MNRSFCLSFYGQVFLSLIYSYLFTSLSRSHFSVQSFCLSTSTDFSVFFLRFLVSSTRIYNLSSINRIFWLSMKFFSPSFFLLMLFCLTSSVNKFLFSSMKRFLCLSSTIKLFFCHSFSLLTGFSPPLWTCIFFCLSDQVFLSYSIDISPPVNEEIWLKLPIWQIDVFCCFIA